MSCGFQTEDPLTARFPDLCRAIKAKRAEVWAVRRSMLPVALEAALSEEPPPTLEQIAHRLGYSSDLQHISTGNHIYAQSSPLEGVSSRREQSSTAAGTELKVHALLRLKMSEDAKQVFG